MATSVQVNFTPPSSSSPSKAGDWVIDPNPVDVPNDHTTTVEYKLNSPGWDFKAISIGQDAPGTSTFVDAIGDTSEQPIPGGTVTIGWSDSQIDVTIKNKSEHGLTLGVALTVGSGDQLQTSRDPQIVLDPSE